MDKIAIRAKDVSKIYKLYHKPSERLLDALGIAGKNRFKEHRALDHVSFEVKKGDYRHKRFRKVDDFKDHHRRALSN